MKAFNVALSTICLLLAVACSSTPPPHNSIAVRPTDPTEVYSITQNVLREFGYTNIRTDQENGVITTEWDVRKEFERETRSRAIVEIKPLQDDRYEIKVRVERQFPTNKTKSGEWDARDPGWTEPQPDNTRQKQLMDRIRERFAQWIE